MEERYLKWIFLLVMSSVRIGMGIIYSITGPTLPVLAEHLCQTPDTVGWILAGRSAGLLIGSLLAPMVDKTDKLSHMFLLFISAAVCGASLGIIPILEDLWIMILVISITGIMLGYIDAAIQVIILKIWGSTKSASIIQLHHFTFSIGAFIAPLIVRPFFENSDEGVCDAGSDPEACNGIGDKNIILTPYLIGMAIMLTAAALVLWLFCINIVERIKGDEEVECETRKEDKIGTVWIYFIFVTIYYFCIVGGENTYQANIFSWAVCTDVSMNIDDATVLNSIFWAGFGFGRGSGIFVSRFISPGIFIIIDLALITASSVVLLIWPEDQIILWVCTFFYGLGTASFYGSGISYSSILTNMSGKWFFIFGLGNALGNLSMPVLGTSLVFSDSPYNFLLQMFAMAVGAVASFIGMWFFGYHFGALPAAVRAREAHMKNGDVEIQDVRISQVSPTKEKELTPGVEF